MNKLKLISIFVLISTLLFTISFNIVKGNDAVFDENYMVTWGQDHVFKLNQGKLLQLSMDRSSGSGFESKNNYGSGFFQMRIKLPAKDSAGVVTAFYLTSKGNRQDEVDFEFLGNKEGKAITLQTNVFVNGEGKREQRLLLWFDPSQDFHTYGILWNPYHIVFYIDNIPIRIFKNNTKKGINYKYPSKAMQVVSSLWNGEAWATDGGKTKINWAYAPFKTYFQGFDVSGCHVDGLNACGSSSYWWNTGKYGRLSESELKGLRNVRAKYMNYDYCSDHVRFPVSPLECKWNQ